MLCWNRTSEFPVRASPPGLRALYVQQILPPCRSLVGRSKPQTLFLGSDLLSSPTRQGQNTRRSPALSGPALAKDPLENVAIKNLLQPRTPHSQSAQAWVMGPLGKTQLNKVNNSYEKALPSRENFWAKILN